MVNIAFIGASADLIEWLVVMLFLPPARPVRTGNDIDWMHLYVWALNFESLNLDASFFACRYDFKISRSNLYIIIIIIYLFMKHIHIDGRKQDMEQDNKVLLAYTMHAIISRSSGQGQGHRNKKGCRCIAVCNCSESMTEVKTRHADEVWYDDHILLCCFFTDSLSICSDEKHIGVISCKDRDKGGG